MKPFNKFLLICINCTAFTVAVSSQSGQRFNNSLRAQYGLYQYNSKQSNFINDKDQNFLSAGLTYRHQLGRISGLNFTARYYKWQTDNENDLKTYATQAMYVLHPKRISTNWRINRLTPYIGLGLGAEKHTIENVITNDTSFFNLYIPAEAGILFNLNSRWSVGIFAEYKFAAAADIKKLTNNSTGKLDIVNAGGITLAYNFGKNKRMIKAPVVVTNMFAQQTNFVTAKHNADSKQLSKPNQSKSAIDTLSQAQHNAPSAKETSADTMITVMVDSANNLFRTPPSKYLMEPKDSINTDILNANADLLNDFSDDDINLPDSFKTRKTYISNDAPLQTKLENATRIDSLIRVINQLKNRINSIPSSPQTVVKERTIIETEKPDVNDSPIVIQLKDSYNRLGESAERNYRQGYINENRLQEIRNETEDVKRSIRNLAQENGTHYNESDRIFATIALMQRQQDAMRRNASSNNSANINEQRLQQEIDNLQYKFDKTLLELDSYKQAVQKPTDAQPELNQLTTKQNDLESRFKALEELNQRMVSVLEKMTDAPETKKEVAPVVTDNIVGKVKFASNSSKIDMPFMATLNSLVESFKNGPETIFLLSGFADKTGSAAYNLALSKRRVQAVKNALVTLGYKRELIIERYFGSNKAAETQTDDDRKVVIRALKQ